MSRMPLGRHGFHGAFLDAVTGIIETAGIFYQTKFFVLAVAGATSANSDESGLIEGCGKRNFVPHPPMSRAADDAARKPSGPPDGPSDSSRAERMNHEFGWCCSLATSCALGSRSGAEMHNGVPRQDVDVRLYDLKPAGIDCRACILGAPVIPTAATF